MRVTRVQQRRLRSMIALRPPMRSEARYRRVLKVLEDEEILLRRAVAELRTRRESFVASEHELERRLAAIGGQAFDGDAVLTTGALAVALAAKVRIDAELRGVRAFIARFDAEALAPAEERARLAGRRCKTVEALIEKKLSESAQKARRAEGKLTDENATGRWIRAVKGV